MCGVRGSRTVAAPRLQGGTRWQPTPGQQEALAPDAELKARHRAMWASGDYPSMVETFLLAARPAARRGVRDRRRACACSTSPPAPATPRSPPRSAARSVDRERPHARAARGRPRAAPRRAGVELEWVEADAEHLPFEDASFDVVMSVDRRDVRAAPPGRRRRARPRLPPGRHDRPAELDARGHDRRAVPHDGPVRAAAPARRAAAAAVGQRGARARAVRRPRRVAHARARRARGHRLRSARATTASTSRRATARRSPRAPTPRATAARPSSTRRSTRFCDEWNRGTRRRARASRWSTCSRSATRSLAARCEALRRGAGLAPRGHAELAPARRRRGGRRSWARSRAPRRSPRSWRPRASRSSTSVSRGVSPAGPGARGRRAGRAGSGARRRRAAAGAGAAAARAAPSSSKRGERLEPRGLVVGVARAPRRARTGSRAPPTRAAAPRQSPAIARAYGAGSSACGGTGAPARHSQSASSPRAHASPRASASA